MQLFPSFISEPLELLGRLIDTNKKVRLFFFISSMLSLLSGMTILVYLILNGPYSSLKSFERNTIYYFFIMPGLLISAVTVHFTSNKKDDTTIRLETLLEERKDITQKIEKEDNHDIFHTIQLSLNQGNEYYTINKGQAKNSFNFSIFVVALGLSTIIGGIWLNYFKIIDIQITYITGVSGILLEFIGGTQFFIYKKSIDQVNLFYNQLIKIQDTMLAIKLAEHNENIEKRFSLEEKIIISLLERSLR